MDCGGNNYMTDRIVIAQLVITRVTSVSEKPMLLAMVQKFNAGSCK